MDNTLQSTITSSETIQLQNPEELSCNMITTSEPELSGTSYTEESVEELNEEHPSVSGRSSLHEAFEDVDSTIFQDPHQINPSFAKYPVSYALVGNGGGFVAEPSSEGWYTILSSEDTIIPGNRTRTCDTGVILYVNENCFIQLDHKHTHLEVKTGVLDDTDCGRLEIIVKNKTDEVVYITKGEPIARIQFNRVNFPGPIAINKKDLQDFINKLLFSRRQRMFVTIPSTMCITDDLTSPNDVITIPKSLSGDDSQNLDESVDDECMMALDLTKTFGVKDKQVWGSTAGNCSDDELDDVSDDEVSSNKRKWVAKPKLGYKKNRVCVYLSKGKVTIN